VPRSNEVLLQQLHIPPLKTRIIMFLCCQKLQLHAIWEQWLTL